MPPALAAARAPPRPTVSSPSPPAPPICAISGAFIAAPAGRPRHPPSVAIPARLSGVERCLLLRLSRRHCARSSRDERGQGGDAAAAKARTQGESHRLDATPERLERAPKAGQTATAAPTPAPPARPFDAMRANRRSRPTILGSTTCAG